MSQEPTFDLTAFRQLYLSEAGQGLALLRQKLRELAQEYPVDPAKDLSPLTGEILTEAHRIAHMLKGMSAAMRYDALAGMALEMEARLYQAAQPGGRLDRQTLQELESRCDQFQSGLARLAQESGD